MQPRISALEATANLVLVPNDERVEEALDIADVFFLSSREDPMPTVAFEAWATGLPVVALKGTGGIADLVQGNAVLGHLAESFSPVAAASAIDQVSEAEKKSPKIANARRGWVKEHCAWEKYVLKLLTTLEELPSVDVAIIGYNHGRYAGERIDTITNQTLQPNSIRYLDVSSTDNSLVEVKKIAAKYGTRVDVVSTPANQGKLYKTWLEAAESATAEYLYLGEGDDYVDKTFLERCVQGLNQSRNIGFAFAAVSWVDQHSRQLVASHLDYVVEGLGPEIRKGGVIRHEVAMKSRLLVKNPILNISSVVWRREKLISILRDSRGSLPSLNFAFDWFVYYKTFEGKADAYFVPLALTMHRQHRKSFATNTNIQKHSEEVQSLYELVQCRDSGLIQSRSEYLLELRKAAKE